MNHRYTRTLAGVALVATVVSACGVSLQDEPQPIEQSTPQPTATPTTNLALNSGERSRADASSDSLLAQLHNDFDVTVMAVQRVGPVG